MISPRTLAFLKQLRAHNRRDWFHAHREQYLQARADVVSCVDQLIGRIARFDPSIIETDPADTLFRIQRDTRFSKDKAPYKTNFGAFLTDRGRNASRAGYYLHIEPGGCLLAGGLYMPPPPALKAVRKYIAGHGPHLRRLLARKKFVSLFGAELPGRKLRTAPRDYPKDHPEIDLLRYCSFEVVRVVSDQRLLGRAFADEAARVFAAMHDFIQYLNRALDATTEGTS